ncbi:MAG: SpoIIIAH-like family protein [Lachnospiraceae bacterium]|nr:SpoIIIAH-like family protein [Lachnospiraceae bacterium]
MKTVFKKNQIIITALAIMIAVVGYLNFSGDYAKERENEEALKAASNSYEEGKGTEDEGEEYSDLSAEDLGEDQFFMYEMSDSGELVLRENRVLADGTMTEGGAEAASTSQSGEEAGENSTSAGETAPEGTPGAELPDGTEVADASEHGTSATGSEETSGDGTPGEAVLASATIQKSYFANAKLNREQMRARNKEILMSVVSDTTVADELKQDAINEIIAITTRAEKENEVEILLEAKGYEGVVVSLAESEVDVVVNAESITLQQVAQIEDIVSRKTGLAAEGIVITTVVTEE